MFFFILGYKGVTGASRDCVWASLRSFARGRFAQGQTRTLKWHGMQPNLAMTGIEHWILLEEAAGWKSIKWHEFPFTFTFTFTLTFTFSFPLLYFTLIYFSFLYLFLSSSFSFLLKCWFTLTSDMGS